MVRLEMVLEEWFMQMRIEKGASQHTISNYMREGKRWLLFLDSQGIDTFDTVTAHHVTAYIEALSNGSITGKPSAAASLARALSVVRSFHRFAVREGYCSLDPTAGVHPPRAPEHLPKALTIDEVASLLACAHKGERPSDIRDTALLELLYATGARVSEAVSLSIDDLDLDAELPVVRFFGKGRKERVVPMGSYAREALAAYLVRARPVLAASGKGTHHVFLGLRGTPMSRQLAWAAVARIAEMAGLNGRVSPHTLRHSFATHLLEGGASIRDVQELLGHAHVQTTQIYTRVTALTLREVHRASHPRASRAASAKAMMS
ncbi:site-specific tyrosine recombinase XerD [Schaalia sp. lx-100]|uniref:site-specific tyrosine recombinase XerD n=1 Tax=Schaalia sp. lx-100 TaxID=2899081 RepID=UPI001E593408|nr:site-specific tyrosine recombinase XerD [Schaalia sp. lx-100]MCD4557176.1 site-specific tyrosine recombinase XerD [Schaalia sp. lx-100]